MMIRGPSSAAGRLRGNRAFVALWLARTASYLGDFVTLTALVLYLYDRGSSATDLGVVLAARALPQVLGPIAGALAGLPAGSYALLFMLAVVHTTLGFALYTFGLGRLGAGRAAIVATIEPVVAVALGVMLLAEDLTLPKSVGAGLVISGAVLAQVRVRKYSS